jgi:hypothetical protein
MINIRGKNWPNPPDWPGALACSRIDNIFINDYFVRILRLLQGLKTRSL